MTNIVLAAGYATRMYPLTENFPKPLLRVHGSTILDSLLQDVDRIPEITSHVVVTNHRFAPLFRKWADSSSYSKRIEIIDDGSMDNEHRAGAVKDLLLAVSGIEDDFLVIAADNLLDFSLAGFVSFFKEKGTSAIMCHHEPSLEALRRTGVVVIDADNKVLEMAEKPLEPRSHWAVPPFYCYSRKDLPLIRTCLDNGCGFDAPGNLARYLCARTVVHAYEMPGHRIDIGDLETYRKLASE